MASPAHDGDAGASTLVLIRDAEFELHASRSLIVFPTWGSVEAKGTKRSVKFSISLRLRDHEDASTSQAASVPLVITAPFTSRFHLRTGGASLIPLLRAELPLQFEVDFAPPRDDVDCDFGSANFQDQIHIQTRLAKLCIRLCALREQTSADQCAPESFTPRVLPTVKAPSLKLFDQIERDAATVVIHSQQRPTSSGYRTTISGSFHPQKNSENKLDTILTPLPPRQPTPPQQEKVVSRPASSSSRRTPSPRVLEPLVAPPVHKISAAVDNHVEAREVILRLRARRASHNYAHVKKADVNDHESTGPEIQLDARAKAELDEFNTLVKAAKINIAGEMSKAKEELEFYKSLLPGQPPTGSSSPPQALPSRTHSQIFDGHSAPQKGLPKKPAKLPSLSADSCVSIHEPVPTQDDRNQNTAPSTLSSTNQETSPVKRTRSKPVTKLHVNPVQSPEAAPTGKHAPRGDDKAKVINVSKPKVVTKPPNPVLSTYKSNTTKTTSSTTRPVKPSGVVTSKPSQIASKNGKQVVAVGHNGHALDDFDDADPEIDDAPVLPDDLRAQRRLREEEDEEDPMLTMKVPLY